MKNKILVYVSYMLVKYVLSSSSFELLKKTVQKYELQDILSDHKRAMAVEELKVASKAMYAELAMPNSMLNLFVEIVVNYAHMKNEAKN